MYKNFYIQSYCYIRNNQLWLDGEVVFDGKQSDNLNFFLKSAYRNLEIKYSKFFKMDNLSKISFLAAETIFKNIILENKNTAIVFSNKAASLETDRKFQDSISNVDNFYPSPAVFVYTLPNIGIGEISIRHNLKSESAFFIFENYNANFHQNYENELLQNTNLESVLGGWVNVDGDNYDAFVYLVSKKGNVKHTKENLLKLYKG
ncbi:MAG: 3-oxoacyl-ACP synthase [Flavobacteriaceae bacterium]|nr:3-oxoacyl-ACP synthase [Flavobacteriaceae bacterium]